MNNDKEEIKTGNNNNDLFKSLFTDDEIYKKYTKLNDTYKYIDQCANNVSNSNKDIKALLKDLTKSLGNISYSFELTLKELNINAGELISQPLKDFLLCITEIAPVVNDGKIDRELLINSGDVKVVDNDEEEYADDLNTENSDSSDENTEGEENSEENSEGDENSEEDDQTNSLTDELIQAIENKLNDDKFEQEYKDLSDEDKKYLSELGVDSFDKLKTALSYCKSNFNEDIQSLSDIIAELKKFLDDENNSEVKQKLIDKVKNNSDSSDENSDDENSDEEEKSDEEDEEESEEDEGLKDSILKKFEDLCKGLKNFLTKNAREYIEKFNFKLIYVKAKPSKKEIFDKLGCKNLKSLCELFAIQIEDKSASSSEEDTNKNNEEESSDDSGDELANSIGMLDSLNIKDYVLYLFEDDLEDTDDNLTEENTEENTEETDNKEEKKSKKASPEKIKFKKVLLKKLNSIYNFYNKKILDKIEISDDDLTDYQNAKIILDKLK